MKRFHNGVIILDAIDVMCISFSAASTLAYLYKRYKRRRRGKDPLIKELKEKSPVIMFSEDNKPLKVPLVRGGDKKTLSLLSLVIKNEKLSNIMRAPVNAKKKQRELILLQYILFCGNTLLTNALGLRIAVGGSLDYTQIILIGFPSTVGGFLIGVLIAYPYQIASALLPLAILTGRGIEDIPDPYANCKAICKAVEKYHNNKMTIEMKKLNSVVEDASAAL